MKAAIFAVAALALVLVLSAESAAQRIRIPSPAETTPSDTGARWVAAAQTSTATGESPTATLSAPRPLQAVSSQVTVPAPATAPATVQAPAGAYPAPAATYPAPAATYPAPAGTYPAPAGTYPAPSVAVPAPAVVAPAPTYPAPAGTFAVPGSGIAPPPVVTVPGPGVRLEGVQPAPRAWDPYATPVPAQDILAPPYMCSQSYQGFEGGAELVFLKPSMGDLRTFTRMVPDVNGVPRPLSFTFPRNDYDPSGRFWLGYVLPSGLGLRTRFWYFDHPLASETGSLILNDPVFVPPPALGDSIATSGRLLAYTLDAELSQVLEIGPWHTVIGGGIRYAAKEHDTSLRYNVAGTNVSFLQTHATHFYGLGPTIFAELRRPLGQSGFSLVGKTRGSILVGDTTYGVAGTQVGLPFGFVIDNLHLPATNTYEKVEQVLGIGEIQLGLEWARRFPSGAHFFLSALWEAQIWSHSSNVAGIPTNDLGLMGASIGIGVRR